MKNGVQRVVQSVLVNEVSLDPRLKSVEVKEFESGLQRRIVGQAEGVQEVVSMYQIWLAGMSVPGRPIGNLLFLGPTGCGKTRIVEAAAEILFGNPRAVLKINCAEYHHDHDIAKLIGSPPGYIGHRETSALLTQEAIDLYQTDRVSMSFLLFDEIEKANDALWQLLLGILDKATLTLGDNRRVDFSRCIIFMTSNLGAKEIINLVEGGIGFTSGRQTDAEGFADLHGKMSRVALDAAKRKFSPEFMNRIDKTIVFQSLTPEDLRQILEIELEAVQSRITASRPGKEFVVECTSQAKAFLLREGTDQKYGARHLNRAIERYLVYPISNLVSTGQIGLGDIIKVDLREGEGELTFSKERVVRSLVALAAAAKL